MKVGPRLECGLTGAPSSQDRARAVPVSPHHRPRRLRARPPPPPRCALRDRGLHEQAVQPPLQRRLEARAGIVPVESRAERVSGVWSLV